MAWCEVGEEASLESIKDAAGETVSAYIQLSVAERVGMPKNASLDKMTKRRENDLLNLETVVLLTC